MGMMAPGAIRDREEMLQLTPRLKESELVRRFASSCIDTSDGLAVSLKILSGLNHCGFDVAEVPFAEAATRFCEQNGVPRALLALGECGEYELLFTVRPASGC